VPGAKPSFLNQLMTIWSRLQPTQRATIVLSTVLVFAGLATLVFFMNRVEYVVLYRDLNREDAAAVAAKLKELKKDYHASGSDQIEIEVAGTTAEIDKLRLDIAGAGLVGSGRVGFEIFDKNQFGMTDFTEQVNYKRALEGELSRTIGSLSEISEARVHLVMPKESLFDDKKEEATASVLVRLKRGKELPKTSIAGIVNLVAGAVQGLPTYNVSVVDSEGRVLSRLASGDGARSDLETGMQAQLEKELVAKVVSTLEPTVGKGKVLANASVDVDFNSSEQTEETYQPTPPPVILSQHKTEERVGSAGTTAGTPGTRSNQGGDATAAAPNVPDRSRQSELTNYEVSKLVKHTVLPKGTVQRISLAVLLDYKPVYKKGADGKTITSFQEYSKEELDKYRNLVCTAVGFNENRGDAVTLENMPFFTAPAIEEDKTPLPWYIKWQQFLIPGMKYAAFLVLFLLVYLLFIRPVRKRVLQSIGPAQPALPTSQPRQLSDGTAGSQNAVAGEVRVDTARQLPRPVGQTGLLESDIEEELMRESEAAGAGHRKYDVLKKKIVEHAIKEPEQASQLVRAWIHEQP
jgi:flagellar M-ring protein FliF